MTRKDRKLAKKLKNFRKNHPPMSKKQERKTKRAVRKLRQGLEEQRDIMMKPLLEKIDEDLERQRILREVEQMEQEETDGP